VFITPAVAGRHVYIGSCAGSFLAFDRTSGERAWSYDTAQDGPAGQFHGDALIGDKLVVVGSDARPMGRLYAFDRKSGELRWKVPFPGGVASEPQRHGDRVLVVTAGGEVLALDLATGSPVWTFDDPPEGSSGTLDPTLAGDRFLVPWRTGFVDAFDVATGEHLWRTHLGAFLNTSAVMAEGELVVGGLDGLLYRLRLETGEVTATYDTGGAPFGDLTVGDGCLFALWAAGGIGESMEATGPFVLACLDPDLETVRWQHATEREWSTFRPLVRDGRVIVGSRNTLLALDPSDGHVLWQSPVDGVPRGLGASKKVLYVGTLAGKVLSLPLGP